MTLDLSSFCVVTMTVALDSLYRPTVSKVKHADNLLWGYRVILFIDVIVMPSFFLCFVLWIINHDCQSS